MNPTEQRTVAGRPGVGCGIDSMEQTGVHQAEHYAHHATAPTSPAPIPEPAWKFPANVTAKPTSS